MEAPPKKAGERFLSRIEDIQRPTDSLCLVTLRIPPGVEYPFRPGQFCFIYAKTDTGEMHSAYSIASAPTRKNVLQFAVKKVAAGHVADWLYHRNVGDEVTIGAPLGTFAFKSPKDRDVVFLATGTGVGPLRSMILEHQIERGRDATWLFLGSGHPRGIPYHEEFLKRAAEVKGFHYVPTVSDAGTFEWSGQRGWIQEPFTREFRGRTDFDAYVCGAKRIVDDVVELLQRMGLPPDQIYREKYA